MQYPQETLLPASVLGTNQRENTILQKKSSPLPTTRASSRTTVHCPFFPSIGTPPPPATLEETLMQALTATSADSQRCPPKVTITRRGFLYPCPNVPLTPQLQLHSPTPPFRTPLLLAAVASLTTMPPIHRLLHRRRSRRPQSERPGAKHPVTCKEGLIVLPLVDRVDILLDTPKESPIQLLLASPSPQ